MVFEKLTLFDTTLRDGGHCRESGMTCADKLEIARQLARLGVDVIEAGFPGASEEDSVALREICQNVNGVTIAALSRNTEQDIEQAAKALEKAESARIHIYMAAGNAGNGDSVEKRRAEIQKQAQKAVRTGKKYFEDIEFSPLDASRTDEAVLVEMLEAAIEAGAGTVNISDTLGYSVPEQFGDLIRHLKTQVKNVDRVIISVHCHNDLGLAVANSLAAVKAGARQVECTVNGIGERAGNAALEEIVMALKARQDYFGLETGVNTREIQRSSELVSRISGYTVQQNKAVVGENAFRRQLKIPENSFPNKNEKLKLIEPEEIGLKEI